MDSPTVCGQTVIMDDKDLFVVKPRGTVGLSNPPVECTVVLQQPYSSDKYVFEVEVEYAQFQDCSVQLMVFSGPTPDGKYEVGSYLSVNSYRKLQFMQTLLITMSGTGRRIRRK